MTLHTFSSGIDLDFSFRVDDNHKWLVGIDRTKVNVLQALWNNKGDYSSGLSGSFDASYPKASYTKLPEDNSATSTTLNSIHTDLDSDLDEAQTFINKIGNTVEDEFSNGEL